MNNKKFNKLILTILFCIIANITYAEEEYDFDVKDVYVKTCEILHYTPIDEKIIIQSIKEGQTRYEESTRTIYIRIDQIKKGILAHEFCHVILANRFIAYPNEFISELLAKYVEFEIQKVKDE